MISKLALEKKCYTSCVLLDIKGAFDNTWHPAIISRLSKSSCPTYLIRWINSFLTCRSANLKLNNIQHETLIKRGCPQGSVLSPFLWNMVVDEALRLQLPVGVKLQAFADEIIISKRGINQQQIEKHLQIACNWIIQWGSKNYLTFSAQKTELITFSRKHRTLSNLTIIVNDVVITPKSSVKYLGVILDQKLKWREHIEERHNCCKRKIMELRRYSKLTWGPNRNILKKLLNGIVDPMLLYATPVWADATNAKWCQTKLRSIQRLILATTLRSFRTISTRTALVLSGSIPIEKRAKILAIQSQLKRYNSATVRFHMQNSAFTPAMLRHCNIDPSQLGNGVKTLLHQFFRNLWEHEWSLHGKSHTTKQFFPEASAAKILSYRRNSYQLIQVLSGHSRLNGFLNRIGKRDDPTCDCGIEEETMEHFLFSCPLHHMHRITLKNVALREGATSWPPPLAELAKSRKSLEALSSLCIKSGRLNFDWMFSLQLVYYSIFFYFLYLLSCLTMHLPSLSHIFFNCCFYLPSFISLFYCLYKCRWK